MKIPHDPIRRPRLILPLAALLACSIVGACANNASPPKGEDPPTKQTADGIAARIKDAELARQRVRLENSFRQAVEMGDHFAMQVDEADDRAHFDRRKLAEAEGTVAVVDDAREIVKDRAKLLALGKALFWDPAVGSDGQTACATCHHQGGADARQFGPGVTPGRSAGVALRQFTGLAARDGDGAVGKLDRSTPFSDAVPVPEQLVASKARQVPWLAKKRAGRAAAGAADEVEVAPGLTGPEPDKRVEPPVRKQAIGGGAAAAVAVAVAPGAPQPLAPTGRERAIWALYGAEGRRNLNAAPPKAAAPAEVPDAKSAVTLGKRQLTQRNAPSVINSAAFDRQFHDGHARSVFNGYDHLGDDGLPDLIGKWRVGRGGGRERVLIRIPDASLASLSVLPPISHQEMSWFGRRFYHIAQKLIDRRPLAEQTIDKHDPVLRSLAAAGGPGLSTTYRKMVAEAFHERWIGAGDRFAPAAGRAVDGQPEDLDPTTGQPASVTQLEANFPLFFGLALMEYQRTLIADQTPYDLHEADLRTGGVPPKPHMAQQAIEGLRVLRSKGCIECHALPETTSAARSHLFGPLVEIEDEDAVGPAVGGRFPFPGQPADRRVEFMRMQIVGEVRPPGTRPRVRRPGEAPPEAPAEPPRQVFNVPYDAGFYSIGVGDALDVEEQGIGRRDSVEDPGNVTNFAHAFGDGSLRPLSEGTAVAPDGARRRSWAESNGEGSSLDIPVGRSLSLSRKLYGDTAFVIGAFKTPPLRNLALTAPYFHDGNAPDLGAVFGQYAKPKQADEHMPHLHGDLRVPIVFSPADQAAAEAFLAALEDPRVAARSGVFTTPSLLVPTTLDVQPDGTAPPDAMKPAWRVDAPATRPN